MKRKHVLVGLKLFFGLLALSAVLTEVVVLIERGRFVPANFLSFFTIESNVFAAGALLASGLAMLRGTPTRWWLTAWRGSATLYMVITGIVFSTLLAGLDPQLLTAVPWDNTVLHYIMPVVLLLDWLLDRPPPGLRFSRACLWLVYPLGYVVYTLVRGELVGWYPYPFLNPANGGYVAIFWTTIGIAALSLTLTWFLCLVARRRHGAQK